MATTGPRTGYAPVNGLQLYYEVHGSGRQPLILLHGGVGETGDALGFVTTATAARQDTAA